MLYLKVETKDGQTEYLNTDHILSINKRQNGYIKILMGAGLYWDIKPDSVQYVELKDIFTELNSWQVYNYMLYYYWKIDNNYKKKEVDEMTEIKSLDYLKEIKEDNVLTNKDLIDLLQNISYILGDNGEMTARYLIDDIIEKIENGEIDL